jgi:hypothetical protein
LSTLSSTAVQGLNQTVEHFEPWAELPKPQREIRSPDDVDEAGRASAPPHRPPRMLSASRNARFTDGTCARALSPQAKT